MYSEWVFSHVYNEEVEVDGFSASFQAPFFSFSSNANPTSSLDEETEAQMGKGFS